jgi:hypothetical protein
MPFNTTIEDADELIKDMPNHDAVGWWNSTSQQMGVYSKLPHHGILVVLTLT